MNIVFRTDASIDIGSGHVMRCLTLAIALRNRGYNCSFICRDLDGNLIDLIYKNGFQVHKLISPLTQTTHLNSQNHYKLFHETWLGVTWQTDAEQTKDIIVNEVIDWLIVDHYALDSRWENLLKQHCNKLMVIDDLADRSHQCDLLLDQNYYRDMDTRYEELISKNCTSLIGPNYALLRSEFKEARQTLRNDEKQDIDRVFIFFGGSDPSNETSKALKAMQLLNIENIKIDVVLGETNLNFEEINRLSLEMLNVKIYHQVSNISELMQNASLAIGAGGGTLWERCCIGLPSIIWCIAENQIPVAENSHELGVCINLGKAELISPKIASVAIGNLLQNREKQLEMKKKCFEIVNGEGVDYVLSEMEIKSLNFNVSN